VLAIKILKISAATIIVVITILMLAAAYLYKGDLPAEYVDKKYSNDESRFLRFSGFDSRSQEPVDVTALSLPTLIMWGSEPVLIPASVADQFAAALANTTLVVYADVGHVPMEEIPERSAADVVGFLEAINYR
jgi:pimeloyl-ACP methyl ester carboxylesterase